MIQTFLAGYAQLASDHQDNVETFNSSAVAVQDRLAVQIPVLVTEIVTQLVGISDGMVSRGLAGFLYFEN